MSLIDDITQSGPNLPCLLSDGRKRLSTRMFVYALWTAHNEYRGLVLLPPESFRLSFCKPSLLNNHNHSQRGLEMHLFLRWKTSFVWRRAWENFQRRLRACPKPHIRCSSVALTDLQMEWISCTSSSLRALSVRLSPRAIRHWAKPL